MKEMDLKEKISHGDEMLPLCVYNNDFAYSRNTLTCHWHKEMEFIYMSSGQAVFIIGTAPVELTEGQAIIVNSGMLHSGYSSDESHGKYYSIVFDLNMLSSNTIDACQNKYLLPLLQNRYRLPRLIDGSSAWEQSVLQEMTNIIESIHKKHIGYELFIKASLYKILSHIILNNGLDGLEVCETNEEAKIVRLKEILNYIKMNYSKNITIDELSRKAKFSRFYFTRLFKSIIGMTPVEYINYLRINQAVSLLEDNRRSIMDISMDVGFNNFSYFIKVFKSYKKNTPGEYRSILKK